MARRFNLVKDDLAAEGATGLVAEGVLFDCGKTILCWSNDPVSIQSYEDFRDMMRVHAKDSSTTRVQWIDRDTPKVDVRPHSGQQLAYAKQLLVEMVGRPSTHHRLAAETAH